MFKIFKISGIKLFLSPFALLLTINVFCQNDQQAIQILNKFSSKALGAPSVSMQFRIITDDQAENVKDTLPGSIVLSKDKYKLDLRDNIVWFDGETSWSYLPVEKEVTITKADKTDNTFQSRPSAIFTMYKKGYKSRLIEERAGDYIIDLYPEDLKSDLLRVRLTIGKTLMNLQSLEYKRRDGITITLLVQEYNLEKRPDSGTFTYRPEQYKGVEVIDMR